MRRFLSVMLAGTMALSLAACGPKENDPAPSNTPAPTGSQTPAPAPTGAAAIPGVEDGVLTVGMECQYPPYNWTQGDDANGGVPIVNNPGSYANGYDVMMAQKLCEANGWKLEVMALDWNGLTPALNAGTIDVAIAGQSMTADRMAEVDMAGPYYYATIVALTTKSGANASVTAVKDLTGNCTSQSGTIWYDSCLPQAEGGNIQAPAENAPTMVTSLESGMVDFVVCDLPTASGAVAKNPDLVVLNFEGTEGDFQFASEEERAENVNIGMSVKKGADNLLDALNTALSSMTRDDFNTVMDQAIAVQPAI